VQVADESGFRNFMLWDQDCTDLIGISTVDLRKKMIDVQLLCLSFFLLHKSNLSYVLKLTTIFI